MRIELATPAGDLVSAETYNKLFTMHGVIMVWFFLIPSIPATLGNFLMPLMIGARDLAFPRLNLASWYLYVGGGVFTIAALVAGGVDTGWTFYTPFSTMFSNTHVIYALAGVFVVGFSSILTGLNFIVTVHTMRAPGMTWFRLPLFVWAQLRDLAHPRACDARARDDAAAARRRARHRHRHLRSRARRRSAALPAPVLVLLASRGVHHGAAGDGRRQRDRRLLRAQPGLRLPQRWRTRSSPSPSSASSSGAITCSCPASRVYAGIVFSLLSFIVAIPSAIKVFNWTATLWHGRITFEAPMLYALGFVGLFTFGGMSGLFLAALALDVQLTDTYFVVAHFHYIMVGGTVSAYLGGIHFWWPKITGRLYSDRWARFAAILLFFGFNFTFFPQYLLGIAGMPRRYHEYPPEFHTLNVLSSAGAVILAVGYLLPLVYLGWSLFRGPRAPANPWQATGLEWTTPSPPPEHNFATPPSVDAAAVRLPGPHIVTTAGETTATLSPSVVGEQFDDAPQQRAAATLGMWIVPRDGNPVLRRAVLRLRHRAHAFRRTPSPPRAGIPTWSSAPPTPPCC